MTHEQGFVEALLAGRTGHGNASREIESLPWNEHPKFAGVFLKHLITGEQTGGRLSAHLVRVAAGSAIGDHVHDTQLELHEVAAGSGTCTLEGESVAYRPGTCLVIPQGVKHSVAAGDEDLIMLAKFAPALC
jgi:quercetin dioxygenase-like cupin family protein